MVRGTSFSAELTQSIVQYRQEAPRMLIEARGCKSSAIQGDYIWQSFFKL